MRQVPGVARNTESFGVGYPLERQLRGIGFAHDDGASVQQAAYQMRMLSCRHAVKYLATAAGRQASVVLYGILDQDRDAS